MTNYRAELERRIKQFHRYLEPMDRRAHEVAHGPCFTIFENRHPDEYTEGIRQEEREPALAAVASVFGERGGVGLSQPPEPPDLPDEGWREDDVHIRFVQFSFERDWFCMDLPRQTLSFPEAMEVLWYRTGFFYLRDREQFTLHGELEGYDPFRKIYLYGDEESAAEDTACVFFQVWSLPVDSRLYVSVASFSGEHAWERGAAVE